MIDFESKDIIALHPDPAVFDDRVVWINHAKFNDTSNKMMFVFRSKNETGSVRSDLFVYDFIKGELYCALAWDDWRKGGHHPV